MGAQSFIKFSEEEEVNQKVSPENISESDQDEAQESSLMIGRGALTAG